MNDPLPTGAYAATLRDSEVKDSQHTGREFVKLRFGVVDTPYMGHMIWTSFPFTDPTSHFGQYVLIALDTTLDDLVRHPLKHYGREVLLYVEPRVLRDGMPIDSVRRVTAPYRGGKR